jgi:ATP-dependent DNA ligase
VEVPAVLCPPIQPMLSKPVTSLPPARAALCYEPKFDGFRCLLFRRPDGRVELQSRAGRLLTGAFPEIARVAREHLPGGVVLDGELVIWVNGRLAFPQLQRRMAGSARAVLAHSLEYPAHLVAFDVLHTPHEGDVRHLPLADRRVVLEQILAGAPPQLALCPQTSSAATAREWLTTWPAAGVEGLVIKGLGEPYRGGQRSWAKLRHRSSTEALVCGVTGTLARPETVLLGRRDATGTIRYAGRTRPLGDAVRRELSSVLRPPGAGRQQRPPQLWPQPLPASWLGQFRQPAEPLRYVPAEPDVIAEIEVDTAYEPVITGAPAAQRHIGARWRHPPKMLRIRTDMSIYDVPLAEPEP